MEDFGTKHPALEELEHRLRAERDAASAGELDALKLRALRQARERKATSRQGEPLLRSRLVLLTMIVVGLMMSTTGAGLAIQGSSGSDRADTAQYPPRGGSDQTLGSQQGQGPANGPVSGGGPSGADQGGAGDQAGEQAAATSGEAGSLPFTGLLAIPLIVGGVALVGGGAVLRRRAN